MGTRPSVSPDGLSVVYSTPMTGHGDIYRFDRKTGKNVRLTTNPEFDGYPLFSRDGKHVVFERETGGIAHLWIIGADGRDQRPLTDGPTFDFGAAFTQDGRTIVFCRSRGDVSHVWLMNADGGHQGRSQTGPGSIPCLPSRRMVAVLFSGAWRRTAIGSLRSRAPLR